MSWAESWGNYQKMLEMKSVNLWSFILPNESSNLPLEEFLVPTTKVEDLREAAALDGTDYGAIINCYVQQGLQDSRADVQRLKSL